METTIKERFWSNGNIFRLSTGELMMVWGDNLINRAGYMSKNLFDYQLRNMDSTIGEHVIAVFSPNKEANYFDKLIDTSNSTILWEKYDYLITEKDIREKFGIRDSESFLVI